MKPIIILCEVVIYKFSCEFYFATPFPFHLIIIDVKLIDVDFVYYIKPLLKENRRQPPVGKRIYRWKISL
jgi:hypothetical protein